MASAKCWYRPFCICLRASAAHGQHGFDWLEGLLADGFVHLYGRLTCHKTTPQLFERIQAHVRAGVAAATIGSWNIEKLFVGEPSLHLVNDPRLREHDEAVGGAGFGVLQQLAG